MARRTGAPRLIEWTGERCVPWTPDVQVAYEHYHRYLWAAPLAARRRVLDLGSGEGFGSAILAGAGAASVTGLDVDERAVEHARLNYGAENLAFAAGSAVDGARFEPGSFDLVVAFELIEHVAERPALVEAAGEWLSPDGLLVLSTPDRRVHPGAATGGDSLHAGGLTEEELRALLGERFPNVALWGQRASSGSRIAALDAVAADASSGFSLARSAGEWREAGMPAPAYLIALASRAPIEPQPRESALHDHGLELLRALERDAEDAIRVQVETADSARAELGAARERLHEAERAAGDAERLRDELGRLRARRARELGEELVGLGEQLAEAERRAEAARVEAEAERARGAETRRQLARIEGSVVWQAFQRARAGVYGPEGERSRRGRMLSAALRTAGGTRPPPPADPELEPLRPIHIPRYEHPLVSVLVPMHSSGPVGERAMRALAHNAPSIPFELIVVDDRADRPTSRVIDALENANVIVNEENLGFLGSTNRAAAAARGDYLMLLNDDTEVQSGWLEALVDCAESDPSIAYVGSKLIYPDGRLQEAGTIVWRDASAWNFGRNDLPERPQYNYRRDVDYASAAAALVRTEAWKQVGGFDERFAPGYYEDTDLCFALREHGHRVVYEPRALVVHREGISHGTAAGDSRGKRNQEANRLRFLGKWRRTLETGHSPAWPATDPRVAADRNRGDHVLVVDHRVPWPDCDSGSLRMFELLRALRERGCRVTFLPDNHQGDQPYTDWLQMLGVEVLYTPVDVPAELESLRGRVPLVILSRPQIAARYVDAVRERIPGARIAYDTVDLHYLRESRRADLGEGSRAKAQALRELELALVRSSDTTIVISEPEREEVLREVPGADVRVIPNANDVACEVAPAGAREGLLFVGGFQHTPNLDAAGVLVREIMPLVWRELPECKLTIVGPHAPPEVETLASPRVHVAGWVPDMEPLLTGCRAMIAPLRYGAGMKGKVTQSLAAGLPVVTTSVGAEGLPVTSGEHVLVAEEPAELAEAAIRLCRDDALWARLSEGGLRIAEAGWSRDVMHARVGELLDSAVRR
ncbi:MAG TPA: glycosyltransferase [Thermoleophilaceae bacterium]